MSQSDYDIITRLKKNDLKTLQDLFDAYYKKLVRHSIKFVMKKEIAEEIVQDIFIRIWNNRETLTIEKSIDAYLFASVRNGSINYLKSKYAKIRFVDLDDTGISPLYHTDEDDIITGELLKALHQAIHSLPPRCKVIFNLSRNAGLSNEEIANQLNISKKTVQAQIGIAIQKIKKHLGNQWGNIPS
ncbi:MAG: hypothetical protein AMS27_14375 [Bacteroides sp. SM23_62_1]|nr:MAG: hypothetical protein AMS27_14375 [Bacteroides sp. SM23_62_1]